MPPLTLALERYDRTLPLLEGKVRPEGIELEVRAVSVFGAAAERHLLMLRDQAFDACELSLSSYLMAVARGLPLTAIPVFPRRLFSQSNIYCNVEASIASPEDLAGKRVGLNSYQTTLSVLAKGDLQHLYGLRLESVTWVTAREEAIPFVAPPGIRIERIGPGKRIDEMLERGEIDALIMPRTPRPVVEGSPRVRRLFPDPRAEEISYFHRVGFYPIMHLISLKAEVTREQPKVARALFEAFERSKELCYRAYDDPNYTHLAWGRLLYEEERRLLGPDPWPNGLSRNHRNLEHFIQYSYEQGLIPRPLRVEELFVESLLET